MSDPPELQPYQRALWNVLCWNFPADICQALEDTEHVRKEGLRYMYSILQHANAKPASHLVSKVASLPDTTALDITEALHALNIRGAGGAGGGEASPSEQPSSGRRLQRTELESKPYFYSREREQFWLLVLELFRAGYLGQNTDGSARDQVADIHALYCLYRLDAEDKRCRRDEDVDLRNPAHFWYHEISDHQISWFVGCLWPLFEDVIKSNKA